ncbi:HTH-type transcriptional regulator AcrR [compost metagenome]
MAAEGKRTRMTNRDMQAAERKQQLLDTARRLFAEKGYHATSMRELNKAIGMTEALAYHYFPGGKLDILRAVLQHAQEERITRIVAFLEQTFLGEPALGQTLLSLIDGIAGQIQNDRDYFLILIQERNQLEPEQQEALDALTIQPFQAMEAYLKKLSARGDLREMDFGMAASQFLSHIVVLIVQGMIKGTSLQKEQKQRIVDYYAALWSR